MKRTAHFTPLCNSGQKRHNKNFKTLLTNAPILALPPAMGQCAVDIVERDCQLEHVLLQQHEDGSTRSIGYWSRTLRSAEQKLTTIHKEYMAVVCSVLLL